ncbi:hypothetical protein AGMMS49957_11420 [Synergistales bacterium]|nr:hypothetical protein AGMMS49957_11420 [Synergistales bacterium]
MSTTQPIRDKNQVRELAEYYLKRKELRNKGSLLVNACLPYSNKKSHNTPYFWKILTKNSMRPLE